MQLECQRTPFIDPVNVLLRELSRVGFFEHSLLVGSWPMVIYTQKFDLVYGLATNDIDFAVHSKVHRKAGAPLPELLERLGYESLTTYPSGIEK